MHLDMYLSCAAGISIQFPHQLLAADPWQPSMQDRCRDCQLPPMQTMFVSGLMCADIRIFGNGSVEALQVSLHPSSEGCCMVQYVNAAREESLRT